jgi:hypothetical protein
MSVSVASSNTGALSGDQQLKPPVAAGGGDGTSESLEILDEASKHSPASAGRGPTHQHHHHQGKAAAPHSLKLSKELAALNCSEDVRDDKGVQNGRRQDEREDADSSNGSLRTSSKAVAPTNTQPTSGVHPYSAPADISPVVQLRLTIDKEHTIDGSGREVEFAFAPDSDKYEVVAAEMIQELSLTLQVDALAKTIEAEVTRVRIQGAESQEPAEATTPSLPSPDRRTLEGNGQESSAHTAARVVSPTIDIPGHHAPEAGSASPQREQQPQNESTASPPSERLPSAAAASPTGQAMAPIEGSLAVSPTQVIASHEPIAVGTAAEDDLSAPGNTAAALAPIAAAAAATTAAPPAQAPYFGPSGDRGFIFGPEGVFEDPLMEQELSRIDKEASRASRAFESRIQKHKAIQVMTHNSP